MPALLRRCSGLLSARQSTDCCCTHLAKGSRRVGCLHRDFPVAVLHSLPADRTLLPMAWLLTVPLLPMAWLLTIPGMAAIPWLLTVTLLRVRLHSNICRAPLPHRYTCSTHHSRNSTDFTCTFNNNHLMESATAGICIAGWSLPPWPSIC